METLADVRCFRYPRFFNGRKYKQTIEWLGSALFTSVSSGEASHKSIENAYQHTNRQGDRAVGQVSTAVSPLMQHPECLDRGAPCQL